VAQAGTGGEDGAPGLGLKPLNPARALAWLVFAVTPLGLLTGTFLSHDVMPKVILVLFGAAGLLFLWPQWTPGIARLWAMRHGRWFLWLVMAQSTVLAASSLFSNQPLLSFVGTTWRRFGLVEQAAALVIACCVAALVAEKPESVTSLWRAVVACAGIASVYGIAQYFGFDPFLERRLYAIDYLGGIVRPPATMGHAIYYSAYLVPVILIAAWQVGLETKWSWRAMHGSLVALGPLAILLSGSRGALLGLAAGAILLIVYRRPSKKLVGAAVSAVLVVGGFIALAPFGASVRNRIRQWKEDPGSVRLAVWRETPGLVAKAPWLGSGPETFAGAFRTVESAELARAYPDFINETPHNLFADAACEEGLAGLVIVIALFAAAWLGTSSPGLRAALLGIAVCGLFASLSLVMGMYLWGMAGIAMAGETARARTVAKPAVRRMAVWRMPVWQMAAAPVGIAFVAVAILLAVQDAAYADLQDSVDAKDAGDAKKAMRTATSFGVGLPGYELWASQEMAKLKAWSEAGTAAALAEERGEDRASAAYQGSIIAIVNGDAPGAQAEADKAIALAPNWYKPHLLKAQLLQATGKNAEASEEARVSLNLGWKGK
jgi:hypothetical protein